jgi:hypothetical protein
MKTDYLDGIDGYRIHYSLVPEMVEQSKTFITSYLNKKEDIYPFPCMTIEIEESIEFTWDNEIFYIHVSYVFSDTFWITFRNKKLDLFYYKNIETPQKAADTCIQMIKGVLK